MVITPAFQAGDVGSIPIGRWALGKEIARMWVVLYIRYVLFSDEA